MRFYLPIFCAFILFSNPKAGYSQGFSNQVFSDSIKTVLLSNEFNLNSFIVNTAHETLPQIALTSKDKLTLRFDLLRSEPKNYSYTLLHCNPDWTPTSIFANDYLEGYTEENIENFTFSQNTMQEYIHYDVSFPSDNMKITKSGNYVILVYESGDRNKIVLTQKFYVTSKKVAIVAQPISAGGNSQDSYHQINFKANISSISSTNPAEEYKFVILKNGNQENISFRSPTFINTSTLTFLGTPSNVEAGNEFRQFDTRNINTNVAGIGIYKSVYEAPYYHTILKPISPRSNSKYVNYNDHDGRRFILSQSHKSSFVETDYGWVYFYLNPAKNDTSSSYYVYGELTNWEKIPDAKFTYNKESKQYVTKLYLKQGVYDYAVLENSTESNNKLSWKKFEGNYYQTDNTYSILAYHKDFSQEYYELVGVQSFTYR